MPGRDPLANPEPLLRRVYAYVAYRVGDRADAEDITSETFERALRYRDRYDERRGEPIAWLLGIARNCVYDAQLRPRAEAPGEPEPTRPGVDAEAVANPGRRGVTRLVSGVTAPHGGETVGALGDPGLVEHRRPLAGVGEELGDGRELGQVVQRHPRRGCELDLERVSPRERVRGAHPGRVVDLAAVDGDVSRGGERDEEPRCEPLRGDRGRKPVREPDQRFRVDLQPGLLAGFAHRGPPRCVAVGVVDSLGRRHTARLSHELAAWFNA
jgi:hypothetical protein